MNWFERRFGGHVSLRVFGLRVTLYGFNAMHVALNVWLPRRRAQEQPSAAESHAISDAVDAALAIRGGA